MYAVIHSTWYVDVCLLRLDFETFNTLGAGGTQVDNEGDCMDTFTVTVSCARGLFRSGNFRTFSFSLQAQTPTAQVIPVICGLNTGMHSRTFPPLFCPLPSCMHAISNAFPVYVDIGENSGDTATLAFAFNGANAAFQRMFDIKVTQVTQAVNHAPPPQKKKYQKTIFASPQVECTNANA